jgi:hypothetical protein
MKDWLYSLEALRPLLETYTPPDTSDQARYPDYEFDLISLGIHPLRVGTLSVRSEAESIAIHIDRPGEGDFRALTRCRFVLDETGPNVRQWSGHSWMAPSDHLDQPLPFTELKAEGSLRGAQATIRFPNASRNYQVQAPIIAKWTLPEIVRRSGAGPAFSLPRFDCLDEYLAIHPGHQVEAGEAVQAPGNRILKPYLHTGTALLPWVLWVDEGGQPLIWRSGTEAGILTRFQKAEGSYSDKRYKLKNMKLSPEFQ